MACLAATCGHSTMRPRSRRRLALSGAGPQLIHGEAHDVSGTGQFEPAHVEFGHGLGVDEQDVQLGQRIDMQSAQNVIGKRGELGAINGGLSLIDDLGTHGRFRLAEF